jgi:hypothetical protein
MCIQTKRNEASEQKAAGAAAGQQLLVRFVARDRAVETELVTRLVRDGQAVAGRRYGCWGADWLDHLGEFVLLLYRYRDEGKIPVDQPLIQLARKLVKQVWRSRQPKARRDKEALRWGGGDACDEEWDDRLEAEAQSAAGAQSSFASPELAAEAQEGLAQLRETAKELSATDRATFEAELAADRGEHESLASALGVSEVVARQRRCRMTKALRRFGQATRGKAPQKIMSRRSGSMSLRG